MTMQTVVDAWVTDLLTNVAGLSTVTTKTTHRYASWSPEQLQANTNERHLAVWPNGEALQTRVGLTTEPSDMITTAYSVVVWEEAASEATGLYDDDTANQAWLALLEAVTLRFYVGVNRSLGDAQIMSTNFVGSSMGMRGAVRWFEVNFQTQRPQSFS
jgi:hypothetical protein